MTSRPFILRHLLVLFVALGLLTTLSGQGKDKPKEKPAKDKPGKEKPAKDKDQPATGDLSTKGTVKIGFHKHNLEAGNLYLVRAEGAGFSPSISVQGDYLVNTETLDKGDTVLGYLLPKETKEYRFTILPSRGYGDELDGSEHSYTFSIKAVPLGKKPMLEEKAALAESDPLYKPDEYQKDLKHKAYPLKLKAKQIYLVQMKKGKKESTIDPMVYIEDPAGKIVGSDSSFRGDVGANVVFQPRRDGDYKIIATSSGKTLGDFILTVRAQEK